MLNMNLHWVCLHVVIQLFCCNLIVKVQCKYMHQDVTVYDQACRAEIPFVAHLKKELITGQFNDEQRDLVERYLADFEEANHDLDKFLASDLERQIQIVNHNPISKLRLIHRICDYHEKLNNLNVSVPDFLPRINGTQTFFTAWDRKHPQAGILAFIIMNTWNISMFAQGYMWDRKLGTRLSAKNLKDLSIGAQYMEYYSHRIELLETALDCSKGEGNPGTSAIEEELVAAISLHDVLFDNPEEKRWLFFDKKISPLRQRFPRDYRAMRYHQRLTRGIQDKFLGDVCIFEDMRTEAMRRKLFCWYGADVDPYWRIQPLKIELLGVAPDIFHVHDVFGSATIRLLKEAYLRKARRGWLGEEDDERYIIQTAFREHVKDRDLPELQAFAKTLEKLTGLNISWPSGEVAFNYYTPADCRGPHTDSDDRKYPYDFSETDAIFATVQIGIEAPEIGGGTSFQAARVVAKPLPGSVIFWYSLTSDGFPDWRTVHSACPATLGLKWNVLKWVNYKDQFRKKPCGLKRLSTVTAFKAPKEIKTLQGGKRFSPILDKIFPL